MLAPNPVERSTWAREWMSWERTETIDTFHAILVAPSLFEIVKKESQGNQDANLPAACNRTSLQS